jgi:hypothetical protein
MNIKGKKIRIYGDLDCDCGSRRNKRDKSVFVVGYRLHTLTVIDAHNGQSFPLVSLVAPANHHDSHFLPFLVTLAQAMGIDIQLVTAGTGEVFCHNECSTPMHHVGSDGQEHEFKCGAEPGECPYSDRCPQYRFIPMDAGLFQRIPFATQGIEEAHDSRKNCERSFNLLKNQAGLEKIRVRSQHATMSRGTFSTIAVLLIKMAGKRKKEKIEQEQPYIFDNVVNM